MQAIANAFTKILGKKSWVAGIIVLWFSGIISGVLDNIVLAAALAPVLKDATAATGLNPDVIAWALIFGTNLGGGFTPIGAPPVVLGLSLHYKKTGKKVGWVEFFKLSGTVTLIRMIYSTIFIILFAFIVGG